MKEKRTLLQKLAAQVKKSATRVNPRAKKSFKASLRGRGYSKRKINGVLKQASARSKAAAKPAPPAGTQEPKKLTAARVQKLVQIGTRLRPSPRQKKGL